MEKTRRNILVTGSSRGIGQSIKAALEKAGHNVIGHGTRTATGQIGMDLSNYQSAPELWQAALKQLDGRIDVIVNNAGIFEGNPVDRGDAEWLAAWDETMSINLTSCAQLCRHAVLHFQESGHEGRIVNIASRAAYRGDSPNHWHYAASKGGMVAMTKTIARAYAGDAIYAFAICPGFTMTGMADDYVESRGGEKLLADVPLGRVAQPEEIAEITKFCAIDAPPSMTGAVLDANGASYVR